MKRIILSVGLLICLGTAMQVQAQDPHFSGYYHAPQLLNPASIGKDVDDWRLMAAYRAQWWGSGSTAFNTYTASVEKRVASGATGKNQLGIGGFIMSDVSNAGLLKNNYFSLGAAYNLALDAEGRSMIGLGMQGVYANRIIDQTKTQFQSQFGSMGFQRSIPSDDPVNVMRKRYWDVNLGLQYSQQLAHSNFYLGAAVFHAARPQDGTTNAVGGTNSIPTRVSVQGGYSRQFGSSNTLVLSSVADFQAGNKVVSVGALTKLGVNDPTLRSFNIGVWNRFGDAIIPVAGFEFERMLFTISYDITTSAIKTLYNDVQSFELGFAWQLGRNAGTSKVLQY